ncbi:MAG: nucleotidyltransferase family protein [Bacillota bacterium]
MSGVGAIVLAGGASRRFEGGSKLLHPYGGQTLVEGSLRAPLGASLARIVVVTGAYHAHLLPVLARYPVSVVQNENWEAGLSTSLKAGLVALAQSEVQAALLCLADQPNLPAVVIDQLVQAWRQSRAPIVAPVCNGQRRNPVLFDRSLWPELMQVSGDEGGRSVIRRHEAGMVPVTFHDPTWFADVDTLADLT